MPWHLISPTTCKDFQVNISNELSSSSAAAQSIFSIIVPPWHTHEPWAPSRQWVAERNRVEREREKMREKTAAEPVLNIINNISLDLIFALAREFVAICTRLACLHLPVLLFSLFWWIIMRYIIFASSWHSARLASSISLSLSLPLCAVMCFRGGKRRKIRNFWPFACLLAWPKLCLTLFMHA